MAHDVDRLASLSMGLADGQKIRGTVFGSGSRQIFYDIKCAQEGKFGPGPCSVYRIERSGPGVERFGLRKDDSVGNLHGLARQLSRDISRMWCGAPEPTSGFEGRRSRKRRR